MANKRVKKEEKYGPFVDFAIIFIGIFLMISVGWPNGVLAGGLVAGVGVFGYLEHKSGGTGYGSMLNFTLQPGRKKKEQRNNEERREEDIFRDFLR